MEHVWLFRVATRHTPVADMVGLYARSYTLTALELR